MDKTVLLRRVVASLGLVMLVGGSALAGQPEQITLPGKDIFPESLTSSKDGSIYIGSIGKALVFRAKPGSDVAEQFIAPGTGDLTQVFGVFADDRSATLWVCSNTIGPPPAAGAPAPKPNALHAFDLKSGAHKGMYEFPAGGFCNDIAVGPDGTAYATDTMGMQVLRLPKGASKLEVWSAKGAFGPPGGVLDGISVLGNRVIVNTLATSKLFATPIGKDGAAGATMELKLDRPISRPDGMRAFGSNGLLIVEGGDGGRLSRAIVNGNDVHVTTVKQGYPEGPVAVTVVKTKAYVVEGQLGLLQGQAPAGTVQKPFRATAVEVGKP